MHDPKQYLKHLTNANSSIKLATQSYFGFHNELEEIIQTINNLIAEEISKQLYLEEMKVREDAFHESQRKWSKEIEEKEKETK